MPREWTVKEIRDLVKAKLDKRPCWLQIKIMLALYAKKDVAGVAATGAGKTLSSLLMVLEEGEDKMIFVVTPLNLLGKQNVEALDKAGLNAIAVSSHLWCHFGPQP
jgi:superfamily II DNA or RNA helicase